MAPGPEHPPASLQQEQNKSTRTCRRPAPSAPPNPGPGRGPGAVGTRAERRRGAGASAASFLQPRPRRPQPRLQRRRRRPRGMACLMAAFSVGTAMVSRTSFATRGWLLSSKEAGNPKPGWLVPTPAACERILRALTWGALERCPALPASALATWSLGMLLLRAPGRWRDPEWVASSPTSGQVDGLDLSASWVRGWGCGSALRRRKNAGFCVGFCMAFLSMARWEGNHVYLVLTKEDWQFINSAELCDLPCNASFFLIVTHNPTSL